MKEEREKVTEYKMWLRKGTVGDLVTEHMNDEEAEKFWSNHAKYIEELKVKGEYLREEEVTVSVTHDPLFDDNNHKLQSMENYRMTFLDLSKYGRTI